MIVLITCYIVPSSGGGIRPLPRDGGAEEFREDLTVCCFDHLFAKLPWPGESEMTLQFSSQAATCYWQSNHSEVEAISLSALPKYTTSEFLDLSFFTLSLFNAERQAELTFKF